MTRLVQNSWFLGVFSAQIVDIRAEKVDKIQELGLTGCVILRETPEN